MFLSALDNADADPDVNRRHSEADPRFVELGLVTKPSTSDTMDHTPVFRPLPARQSQQGRD